MRFSEQGIQSLMKFLTSDKKNASAAAWYWKANHGVIRNFVIWWWR